MNAIPLNGKSPPPSQDTQVLLDEQRRLQDRLTHVSRLATIGEMAAGIAHELNQPLAAVANYAQACDRLLALPDPDIQEIRGALQQITAQAVRAGDIIRRLRSLTRPPDARHELADVNALISELTDLIQSDAKHHNVNYRVELGEGLPQVSVDRAQIQQVILNLVRNALEALADAPPQARELTVRTGSAQDGDVEIRVHDNGPGVAQEIVSRLFDPFCTTKPAGTGLGLAMSRSIARAHRGTLEYRRNNPGGACFILRIPCAP